MIPYQVNDTVPNEGYLTEMLFKNWFAVSGLLLLFFLESEESGRGEERKKLRILAISTPLIGHVVPLLSLSNELVNRGYEVTLCVGSSGDNLHKYSDLASRNQVKLLHFIFDKNIIDVKKDLSNMANAMVHYVSEIIKNLVTPLENKSYDVILGEDFMKTSLLCIHSRWKIPIVEIGTTLPLLGTPSAWPTPSVIFGGLSDHLSFAQRFASAIEKTLKPKFLQFFIFSPQYFVTQELCPSLTLGEVLEPKGVDHPFISPAVIGFEYPKSIYPLTHYVGPLISKNFVALSKYPDIANWLATKEPKSVIYLTMGTLFGINRDTSRILLESVMRTNYSLFWCLRKDDQGILEGIEIDYSRVFVTSWGPQFSVLSSKAIHSAIMHGGFNSVMEALWNEVPVIGLPQMPEQGQVVSRLHHYEFGVYVNNKPLLSSEVVEAIRSIDNGGHRLNLKKLKKFFLLAGGVGRAADLVEMYADIGYSDLVPAYIKYQWSWVQYYNADVWLLCATVVLFAAFLCHRCLRCFFICCKEEKVKMV